MDRPKKRKNGAIITNIFPNFMRTMNLVVKEDNKPREIWKKKQWWSHIIIILLKTSDKSYKQWKKLPTEEKIKSTETYIGKITNGRKWSYISKVLTKTKPKQNEKDNQQPVN